MTDKNKHLLKIIALFIDAHQKLEGNEESQSNIRYLLGQTIRQYDVPVQNCHVSKGAFNLWNELTSADINQFKYRESVKCDRLEGETTLDVYTGNAKDSVKKKVSPGDSFIFRQVFHVDHVIPVSFILAELLKLESITEENIQTLLDKMHLCRILKKEDHRMGRTKGRTLDFDETIQRVYRAKEVELM